MIEFQSSVTANYFDDEIWRLKILKAWKIKKSFRPKPMSDKKNSSVLILKLLLLSFKIVFTIFFELKFKNIWFFRTEYDSLNIFDLF